MEVNYQLLNKPLPKEAVKKHPTKTYLSSIKAIYVIERLNEVFGVGKWRQKVEEISCDLKSGMVVVKVIFEVPLLDIYYESYGGNDNGGKESKNFDLGDAYKGATTDGITKIGSYLGIGMDVFKGLSGTTTPAPVDQRAWLDEKGFQYLMTKGTNKDIASAFKNRRMKKEYKEKLQSKI